ncbi:MAG: alpha/beta fold hydrolase [Desulfobacteraceae bacterium]
MEHVVVFSNKGQKMYGIVNEPEIVPGGFKHKIGVIIFHSGGQARRGPHHFYVKVARALCSEGFTVLRYDNRGAGDSEGSEKQTLQDWLSDSLCAMDFFRDSLRLERLILWGLCGGAVLAVLCAQRRPGSVDSLILCNLFYKMDIASYKGEFKAVYQKLLTMEFWRKMISASPLYYIRKGVPNVKRRFMRAFFPSRFERTFEESAAEYIRALPASFAQAGKPTAFIFSTADPVFSGFETELFGNPLWVRHLKGIPVEVFPIEGADHNFSSLDYEAMAIEKTVSWAVGRAG